MEQKLPRPAVAADQVAAAQKLAVLIPAMNGGELLRESIESCATAGLPGSAYDILVVDNASTDRSAENLPSTDRNGARIVVHRNAENVGRVGNWNRAIEVATAAGYRWAAFLFVGDRWLPDGPLPALLRRMEQENAVFGMGGVRIATGNGTPVHTWERITVADGDTVYSPDLAAKAIRLGYLPFGPIQANIYRLSTPKPLRFTPDYPLSTDVETTIRFLYENPGSAVIAGAPLLEWRIHSKRYSSKVDPEETMREDTQLLVRLSASSGVDVDWRRANSRYLLSGLFGATIDQPFHKRLAHVPRVLRFVRSRPGGLSPTAMASLLWNKLVTRQSYVSFP